MVKVCNEFVIKGREPFIPVSKDTIGKIMFDSLMTNPPDVEALVDVFTGKSITYRKIFDEALNLAEALRRYGCTPDTVISISSENNLDFFIPVVASLFAGTMMAPLNPLYTPQEVGHVANLVKPKIIFASQLVVAKYLQLKKELSFVERVVVFDSEKQIPGAQTLRQFCYEQLRGHVVSPNNFVPFNRDAAKEVAFILCSSGTTGLPKGVMITHTNMAVRVALSKDPFYIFDVHTTIGIMPFFHAFGLNVGLNALINHDRILVFKRFDEDKYLQAIQDYKVKFLSVAPPLAVLLAKSPKLEKYDLSSVKELICGAAPLSKEIEEILKKRLKLDAAFQGYGLTECNLAVTLTIKNAVRAGSVGQVIAGTSLKIRDPETGKSLPPNSVGEICTRGPHVMKGYYNDEQATRATFTEDGWLRTGDLGYYDEDKYFFIVDRLKELIKYKGYQVAPAELEATLLMHPDVVEAGVVGLPDEAAGELPVAFVVKRNENVTEKQIQEFVAKKLSPQKWLRGGVIFVKEIPKNPSGKILRKELRKILKEKRTIQKSKL